MKTHKQLYLTAFLAIISIMGVCGAQQVFAADPAAGYKSEPLPFDPFAAQTDTVQTNTALKGVHFSSIYGVLDLGSNDPIQVTYGIINIVLTFLGFAFLLLLTYAGILWVTARGNEEGVTKAKNLIKRAVIGLIIILSAFGIAQLIFIYISGASYGF